MNLDNIDEKVEELSSQYFKVKKAETRLLIVQHSLEVLSEDLKLHKLKMRKEHQDVIELEKTSKNHLFAVILGDIHQRLERERQEYLQAVLEYNAISEELNLLIYEEEVLKRILSGKSEIKKQLDYYLKVKEQKVLFNNQEQAKTIREMNAEISKLKVFIREIREAEAVSFSIQKLIISAIRNLKKVEKFGSHEFYGVKSSNTFAKKKYINRASKDAIQINYLLKKLDKELSDIYAKYIFFSIYKYQNFIDSFYDYLITDWVLQSKLKNGLNCLESAKDQLQRIIATLENDKSKSETRIANIIEEKRRLLS